MKGTTRLIRKYFVRGAEKTLRAADNFRQSQEQQLARLIEVGRQTQYGHRHRMDRITGYSEFSRFLPVVTYEDIRPDVMKMIQGEKDILWPGKTRRFAQSSGTSDGKSKYIPVTDTSLRLNHYRGGQESVAHYLRNNPRSRVFDGKAFILGGSYANELPDLDPRVKIGDLSAHLIDKINPLVNLLRIPPKKIALLEDWREKLPLLVRTAAPHDVTNISGVPSWFLTVLQNIIAEKGATNIHQIWPNLEVFFHGGIAFGPYREQYRKITDPAKMHYLETYNASEGFFAVQNDPADPAMILLPDAGVFYEFAPPGISDSQVLPPWEVQSGETYALVITACNGLWRYKIGDLVTISSLDPLKITIAGRTKHYINAFGEEVMVYNTDRALENTLVNPSVRTSVNTPVNIRDYTVAPVFSHDGQKAHHQWIIEFETPPADLHAFATLLDRNLQAQNSDYQAKRQGDIFLDCLTITPARPGLFDDWLLTTGKLGGQRKIPRLSNDRKIIDQLLKLNQK